MLHFTMLMQISMSFYDAKIVLHNVIERMEATANKSNKSILSKSIHCFMAFWRGEAQ